MRRRRDARSCQYCGGVTFKLHSGSVYLYVRDGKLKALADMKIYNGCREGLKENIRFLYRMFNNLKSRRLDVLIVGKAYNDGLYAYIKDEVNTMVVYEGFIVIILEPPERFEELEKMKSMDVVDEDFMSEALNEE